jgi:sulfate adenylyltransferase large subunit
MKNKAQSQTHSVEKKLDMTMLRLITAGSVDDGKSTLIGRLLYDSKSIFEDQLDYVRRASLHRGDTEVNLALLTDGLRAEREQGITIDVAYRYFATPTRKYILADTPGHAEFTRNMITGASTADLVILLVDARLGLSSQTRRHIFITRLLQIPNVIVCVNKMDLVQFSAEVFYRIQENVSEFFAEDFSKHNIKFIPVSALSGDNVVRTSENMPWYKGKSVLAQLDETPLTRGNLDQDKFCFPIQSIISSVEIANRNEIYFAGNVASGAVKVGDEVVSALSGLGSVVHSVHLADQQFEMATYGMSVTLQLKDSLALSRGDVLLSPPTHVSLTNEIEATLCWLSGFKTDKDMIICLRQAHREVECSINEIIYKIDISQGEKKYGEKSIDINDLVHVKIKTKDPIYVDNYSRNKVMGSFVLVNYEDGNTLAAGFIL